MTPRYKAQTAAGSQRILSSEIAHALALIENHPRLTLAEFKRLRLEYIAALETERDA